ncbi:MAG: L-threonylcarbamoyladenylate synthase [Fimbriimonadaceae bacterium]
MIVPPNPENIALAAQLITSGQLIGLPTETVYGIAADAFQPDAVSQVFELKGRPADNPLIVHVANVADVPHVAQDFSATAQMLAERFWPGALTLVLRKRPEVPDVVTAGLGTVAVRVPSHSVSRDVIRAAGTPLAAPSANRFMAVSPTRAEDISGDIAAGLAMILDGGACTIGVESTVIDVTGQAPALLRLGGIARGEIEGLVGPLATPPKGARSSPGTYPRHYAPNARVRIVNRVADAAAGLVIFGSPGGLRIRMPADEVTYARELFRTLHELDAYRVDVIEIEAPPADWEVVWDRLRRAAAQP